MRDEQVRCLPNWPAAGCHLIAAHTKLRPSPIGPSPIGASPVSKTGRGGIAVMKLIGSFTGAALAAAVLAVALPARGEPITLQIGSVLPAAHATSKAMDIFKDEAIRLSDGSMDIAVTKASQRSIRELIDAVRVGQIFATWMSIGTGFRTTAFAGNGSSLERPPDDAI
jgi:hypothetical protein